jgi:polyphosphate kinase
LGLLDMAVSAVRAELEPVTPEPINRELSWLDFNERVLELAADERLPLLERVKFCSIFFSNLDEFFAVRVAGLLGQIAAGMSLRSPDGRSPEETLAAIRPRVLQLQASQSRLWRSELQLALARERLIVAVPDEASPRELRELAKRFEGEVLPILTPMAVGSASPFPHVPSLALSLGVLACDPANGERRLCARKRSRTLHLDAHDIAEASKARRSRTSFTAEAAQRLPRSARRSTTASSR